MNSIIRKVNRRVFSKQRENNILSSLSDGDKELVVYLINFRFAKYFGENISQIKDNYFSKNLFMTENGKRFLQTNYKDMKRYLDRSAPWRLIKRIRNSSSILMYDSHYQFLIEVEQGYVESWCENILTPGEKGEETYAGIYHYALLKEIKKNNELRESLGQIMKEWDNEVGDHLSSLRKLRDLEEKINKKERLIADEPRRFNFNTRKYDLITPEIPPPNVEPSAPIMEDLLQLPDVPIKTPMIRTLTNQVNQFEGEYSSSRTEDEEVEYQISYPMLTSY